MQSALQRIAALPAKMRAIRLALHQMKLRTREVQKCKKKKRASRSSERHPTGALAALLATHSFLQNCLRNSMEAEVTAQLAAKLALPWTHMEQAQPIRESQSRSHTQGQILCQPHDTMEHSCASSPTSTTVCRMLGGTAVLQNARRKGLNCGRKVVEGA